MKIFVGVLLFILVLVSFTVVSADAGVVLSQDTCPHELPWIKADSLDGLTYTFDAGEGNVITQWCYKAGTSVIYGIVDPPLQVFTVESTVLNPNEVCCQDLSHASFYVDPVSSTPTYTATQVPTPTFTPTPVITETEEPTVTPTWINTLPPPPPQDTPNLLPITGADLEEEGKYTVSWVLMVIGMIIISIGAWRIVGSDEKDD